jgi:WD40 repeat protein
MQVAMSRESMLVTLILGCWSCPLAASAEPSPPARVVDQDGAVECVVVDQAGSWLVTGLSDGTARLWDLRAADPFASSAFVLRGHRAPVRRLAITPDGRWLATASSDGMLRVWDLSAKDPTAGSQLLCESLPFDKREASPGWRVETSGNSRWLVGWSGDHAKKTSVWDLRARDRKEKRVELPYRATVGLCRNGRWLVSSTGGKAEKVQVLDLNADDPWASSRTLEIPQGASVIALSPDGRWMFGRHRDTVDRSRDLSLIWDLKEATPGHRVLIEHQWASPPRAAGISPDGRWLAVAFDTRVKETQLWDLRAPDVSARRVTLPGNKYTIRHLAFSPNSRWLVTGEGNGTTSLWDLSTPKPFATGRTLPVSAGVAVVAANSRWLATSDWRAVHIHDLDAPDPTTTSVALGELDKEVKTLLIAADSRWVVTHDEGKTVRCWDLRKVKR